MTESALRSLWPQKRARPLTDDERGTLLRHLPQVGDDQDTYASHPTYAAERVRVPHTFTAMWAVSACGERITGCVTVRHGDGAVSTIRLESILYTYDVAGVYQYWAEGSYAEHPAPLRTALGGAERYASTNCVDAASVCLAELTGLRAYLADAVDAALCAVCPTDSADYPDNGEILASRAYRDTAVFLPSGTIMALQDGAPTVSIALYAFWFRSWLSGAGWAARLVRASGKVDGQPWAFRGLYNALLGAARTIPPVGWVGQVVPAVRVARDHLFALRRTAQEPGANQEARTALQALLRLLPGALVDTLATPQSVWDAVRALLPPDIPVLPRRGGADVAPDFTQVPDDVIPAHLADRVLYCPEYIETLGCGAVVVVVPVAAMDTAPPCGFAVRVDVPDVRALGEVGFVRWVWCPCADLAAAAEAVAGPTSPARQLLQTLGLRLAYLRGRAQ